MGNLLVVKDKVTRFAKEAFNVVMIDDDGDLKIPYNSTVVYISVEELDRSEFSEESKKFYEDNQISTTYVEVWAPVIVDVKPSDVLFKWVATEGQKYKFGGFKVSPIKNTDEVQLIFSHSLAGDTLDPGELKNALIAVSGTADHQDENLQKLFGGKRIEDLRNRE